jgi:signal transduction histidine kinase
MFLQNRKLFTSNVMICMAITLFVYFLLQTPFLHWILLNLIKLLFSIHFSILLNKASFTPSLTSLLMDAGVLVICAYFWTYLRTPVKRIAAVGALGVFLVPVTWYLYTSCGTLIISLLIVIAVTGGMAMDAALQVFSSRVNRKLAEEKHDAEYNILRHLNHNVKPNLQMAKSPITAVISFLESKKMLDEPLAKRLDGSIETIGEALRNSVTSLAHINDILETARELISHEIRREDFLEVDICSLFRKEIAPLHASKLAISVKCDRAITVRLHRQSFIEAMNNLIRNAEIHGFQGNCSEARLLFRITERRRSVVIDYTNNGRRFPENLTERDFVALGGKSGDSPGEGLGGAWIGKVIAAHDGSFEIIRDEHPLHFRITLPKGEI